MTPFSLFDKNTTFGGIYVLFIMNRIQILHLFLIMPVFWAQPYMIWGFIAMGFLSQLNLMVLSKWFTSDFSSKGYKGFVQLISKRFVRFFAAVGALFIIIKITVFTLGYITIIHQFIFPSMNTNWLIIFTLLISCYIASLGMQNTIRFVIIVFLCSVWIIFFFFPFFFPPLASLHNLFPLIPTEWSIQSWKGLLFIWSSLSGPEYLIFLSPWLNKKQKTLKYLTIANTITMLEYLFLFTAALLFFGSHYMNKIKFPVVNMIRYLQSPFLERMDMILISIHMFSFIYVISIYLLFFYGTTRIIIGKIQKKTTRIGFITCFISSVLFILIANEWLWKKAPENNILLNLEIWAGAITYLLVPAILFFLVKRKERI